MKISRYDGSILRLILIGMITDPTVCTRIVALMGGKDGIRFKDKYANIIAQWCKGYLEKYNTCPGENIESIFRTWAESTRSDPLVISQIEDLLLFLSEEYTSHQPVQSEFILEQAAQYFNRKTLTDKLEQTQDDLSAGDIEAAFSRIESLRKVELGYSTTINPIRDFVAWTDVLDQDRPDPLFEYPGDLGKLIGPSFIRGTLFAFQGIDKVGKSYYLLDAAFRCIKRKHRVAFFELGDLGREEVIIRLGQRVLRETQYIDRVRWPTGWSTENPEAPTFKHIDKRGISAGAVFKALRKYTRGRSDLLEISCHPNSSINVQGIESYIQDWARTGWQVDAVIIDYADILAPPTGVTDPNQQVDTLWKQLRKLSQTFNCLVLTATQSGAQAYRSKSSILSKKDFQGRRTKFAEVNGMIGLNATDYDMQNGVTRVNWIVRRKGKWSVNRQVLVAGCLAAGTPIIHSKMLNRDEIKKVKARTDNK